MSAVKSVVVFTIVILSLSACGDAHVVECSGKANDLSGDYLIDAVEQAGGECGGMRPFEVQLEDGVVIPHESVGCELTSDNWRQQSCANHSVFLCDDGEWTMRLEWVVLGHPGGQEKIMGELHTELDRWNGIYSCSSTYTCSSM